MTPDKQINSCDISALLGVPQKERKQEANQDRGYLLPKLGMGRVGIIT